MGRGEKRFGFFKEGTGILSSDYKNGYNNAISFEIWLKMKMKTETTLIHAETLGHGDRIVTTWMKYNYRKNDESKNIFLKYSFPTLFIQCPWSICVYYQIVFFAKYSAN